MKLNWKIIPVLACCIVFFGENSFADKGVFDVRATPHEVYINTANTITVTAEIGADDLYVSSIRLYQVTETGQPIAVLGQMYDDGTHGDVTMADSTYTGQFELNQTEEGKFFIQVTAAYVRVRERYRSEIKEITIFEPLPEGMVEEAKSLITFFEVQFDELVTSHDIDTAREIVLEEARSNSDITSAFLSGKYLCLVYKNTVRFTVSLEDPVAEKTWAAGSAIPIQLPPDAEYPGTDKLSIFMPFYNSFDVGNGDYAQGRFDNATYMQFDPNPPTILQETRASLGEVKGWGEYGTVIVNTHGIVFPIDTDGDGQVDESPVLMTTGTVDVQPRTREISDDISNGRLYISGIGRYQISPKYITEHCGSMKDTVFYFGVCFGLANPSFWDALEDKGAKIAFGWTDTVGVAFDKDTFQALINPMLPISTNDDPVTAQQAFDAIANKIDPSSGANFVMEVAEAKWNNFVFVDGGIVNGDFETNDWTGWNHGGQNGQNFQLILSEQVHGGSHAASLGRWDAGFHGDYYFTEEPYGYEWFYQDFVVPQNVTYLKFHWWMKTYDTAVWDWFDVYIKDTDDNNLVTVLSHAGKPGYDYGPYWTTQMADGGDGWREVEVDISAYRGQEIRIYFDQRLDGFGDQQRVYVDDVRLE